MRYLLSTGLIASLFLVHVTEARWKPSQGDTWNYVLEGSVDVSNEPAEIIDVDYKTNSATIDKIHAAGKKVVCYFSGGTLENFRKDKDKFYEVSNLVRNAYEDWAGENWLDIRKEGLKPLMKTRMQEAINKKCDALEVDNLDGWQQDEVKTWSSPLTLQDTIKYAKWLGETAHDMGISIGLKNGLFMIDDVSDYFDFAINESCATLSHPECHLYKNFLNKGKAVLGISYQTYLDYDYDKLCKNINGLGISMIIKETQTLKQAGSIFDAKKKCGSNFSQPFKSSSSSDSESKKESVKIEKTTVVKTTTTTYKPVASIKKVNVVPSIKSTTTTTTVIRTTVKPINIRPTTTSIYVKPSNIYVKPSNIKQNSVKPISAATYKPIMTTIKSIPTIDVIATTTIKNIPVQKKVATQEPYIINKSTNNAKPNGNNQQMPNYNSNYEMPLTGNNNNNNNKNNNYAPVRNTEPTNSFNGNQNMGKVMPTTNNNANVQPMTSFEKSKEQGTMVNANIEKETKVGNNANIENETKVGNNANIEKETKVENDANIEKETKVENKDQEAKVDTKSKSGKSKNKSKEVSGVEGHEGTVGTGAVVAVTGSVVGAAGVFLLIKKNPKKYQNIKRGLSRRLTTKKAKNSNESLNESYNNDSFNENIDISINSNYRYNFSHI